MRQGTAVLLHLLVSGVVAMPYYDMAGEVGAYYSHEGLGDSSLILRLPGKRSSSSSSSSSSSEESAANSAMVMVGGDPRRPRPNPLDPTNPSPMSDAVTVVPVSPTQDTQTPRSSRLPPRTTQRLAVTSPIPYPTYPGYKGTKDLDKAVPFLSLAFLSAILQEEGHHYRSGAQETVKRKLKPSPLNVNSSITSNSIDKLLTSLQTKSTAFAKLLLTKGKGWLLSDQNLLKQKHNPKVDDKYPKDNRTSDANAQGKVNRFQLSHYALENKKPVLKGSAVGWKLHHANWAHSLFALLGHVKKDGPKTPKGPFVKGSHTLQDTLNRIEQRRKYFTAAA